MQDWLGHITAAIVTIVVVLILIASKFSAQGSSIATLQYRAAKIGALSIAGLLERDLKNMGAYHPCNLPTATLDPETVLMGIDTTSATNRFIQFLVQTERCQAPVAVRYEWTTNGTSVNVSGTSKTVWSMRRLVAGTLTSESPQTVTHVMFKFRRSDGSTIINKADIRRVEVELRMVSPYGIDNILQETRWTTVIHPHGMTLTDWGNSV